MTRRGRPAPWRFALLVLRAFRANHGPLLAGGVAFNALLSLVPLLALLLVALSHVVDPEALLATLRQALAGLGPEAAEALTRQARGFLESRPVAGVVGAVVLLLFSSLAFSALEEALQAVFRHREEPARPFLLSVLLPYLFILLLGAALLLLTVAAGLLGALPQEAVQALGLHSLAGGRLQPLFPLLLVLAELGLFTAFYVVMPVGGVRPRQALLGGAVAAGLWELLRRLLGWYFAHLSYVNVVYGSLATLAVLLLTLEAAAVVLLLGAQVIAERERLEHLRRRGGAP